MIPVHIKDRWAMLSPISDIGKVDEWMQAVKAVQEGNSPQFCRWTPLRGTGDGSFWRIVSG